MATYPKTPDLNRKFVTVNLPTLETAGQAYVVPGFRGKIKKVWSVINAAITVADAVLTVKINNVAVTGGTITVAFSGSAAGDVDSCTPTALNSFDGDDAIEIETDGGPTAGGSATITFELEAT